ncbi:hypothetical protein BMS3Bbin02_00136 [bacterium BMS3Bbin02]|nr:hypothetical protein BMS3Bbin02_00136 [bacterium BMS3Bbin02]
MVESRGVYWRRARVRTPALTVSKVLGIVGLVVATVGVAAAGLQPGGRKQGMFHGAIRCSGQHGPMVEQCGTGLRQRLLVDGAIPSG